MQSVEIKQCGVTQISNLPMYSRYPYSDPVFSPKKRVVKSSELSKHIFESCKHQSSPNENFWTTGSREEHGIMHKQEKFSPSTNRRPQVVAIQLYRYLDTRKS